MEILWTRVTRFLHLEPHAWLQYLFSVLACALLTSSSEVCAESAVSVAKINLEHKTHKQQFIYDNCEMRSLALCSCHCLPLKFGAGVRVSIGEYFTLFEAWHCVRA